MNRVIFILAIVSFFKISGHDHVPADSYKQLFGQLELAYEDLMSSLQKKEAIIKSQMIEIVQLKMQIKKNNAQKKEIEDK